MNKLKKIGIFVLLIILTVCIVFLPQLMSEQNEEKLLNQKIYWDYNIRGGTKITSNQVAELYYNREIRIGTYNDVSLDTENHDPSLMQEKSFELFETVFENNEPICEHIKMIISDGIANYSQNSTLVKIDNQPTALNFIDVVITNTDSVLEFVYEEKTRTLISLSCISLSYYMNYQYDNILFMDSLKSVVKDYYESQWGIDTSKYYYLTEFSGKADVDEYYTEFGILQCPADIKEK